MNSRFFQCDNSFFVRRGKIAQPVSSLSSVCIVFCFDVQELKKGSSDEWHIAYQLSHASISEMNVVLRSNVLAGFDA
jgi:hypothetical protein